MAEPHEAYARAPSPLRPFSQPPAAFFGPSPCATSSQAEHVSTQPSQCPPQDLMHMPRARSSQGQLMARMSLPKRHSPTPPCQRGLRHLPRPTHSLSSLMPPTCSLSVQCLVQPVHFCANLPLSHVSPKTAGSASVSPTAVCL